MLSYTFVKLCWTYPLYQFYNSTPRIELFPLSLFSLNLINIVTKQYELKIKSETVLGDVSSKEMSEIWDMAWQPASYYRTISYVASAKKQWKFYICQNFKFNQISFSRIQNVNKIWRDFITSIIAENILSFLSLSAQTGVLYVREDIKANNTFSFGHCPN